MGTLSADNSAPILVAKDIKEQDDFGSSDMRRITDDFITPEDEYYVDFKSTIKGEYSWGSFGEQNLLDGEGKIYFTFFGEQEGEADMVEEEEEEESLARRIPSFHKKKKITPKRSSADQECSRKRSLFVHSSPTHFPDINRARKSVFGSIFLRTTADVAEEAALLRTVVESSYTMLQSLLNSFEKIISAPLTDGERKQKTLAFRDSVQKALESHGICKTYADGSVHWNIYPITQNYLFSVQIGDNIHQTRNLSRIEDRLLTGSAQKFGFPHLWPTNSIWSGHWNSLGMIGSGTYTMPHGVSYSGKMRDGMFHDHNATLTYPNKLKAVHCVYEKGKLINCHFQFPDLLMHEKENWKYCKIPDRRFWSEVQNGLKPAKIAQKTQIDPPKKIPAGTYDTGDGFYYPKTLMLLSSFGELLRVPVCKEDDWIKKYCRKGFLEPANFRPNLFENWFNYDEDLIQSILKQQANFRDGKTTYEELQQFYADLGILPSCSKYKKRRSPSEIALEEYKKSVPEPKRLGLKRIEKYHGHRLPEEILAACKSDSKVFSQQTSSKTFLKFSKESKSERSHSRASKISFKITSEQLVNESMKSEDIKRRIPEKYLKYQPLLKLPLERSSKPCTPVRVWRECVPKSSFVSSESFDLGEDNKYTEEFIQKKNLERFLRSLILDLVTKILIKERERHRQRFIWARKFPKKDPGYRHGTNERCVNILQELFHSIPEKEEYCDSDLNKTCDLKKLAEDKHNDLLYWGKRIFLLDFNEKVENKRNDFTGGLTHSQVEPQAIFAHPNHKMTSVLLDGYLQSESEMV